MMRGKSKDLLENKPFPYEVSMGLELKKSLDTTRLFIGYSIFSSSQHSFGT